MQNGKSLETLRDSGFQIRDRDLKKIRDYETQNTPKARLWDPSQTPPKFRDRAKIFQDLRFSRNNSITKRDLRTEFLKNPEVTKC